MKRLMYYFGTLLLLLNTPAIASVIPFGVQNNISVSTVTDSWGWDFLYRGNYGSVATIDSVFGSLNANDNVMIGGIDSNTETFIALAATTWGSLSTYTGLHETHADNGAEWYFNGYSMGFAGLGDTIRQTSADTLGQDEDDRLSWHTNWYYTDPQLVGCEGVYQDSSVSPCFFGNGWRVGSVTGIYDNTQYDMAVMVTRNGDVSIPAPLALMGLGLVALGYSRKRKA